MKRKTNAYRERTRKVLRAAEVATAELERRGAETVRVTVDLDALVELLQREWTVERAWIDLARTALDVAGRALGGVAHRAKDEPGLLDAAAFVRRASTTLPAGYVVRRIELAERALDRLAALVDGDTVAMLALADGARANVTRTWDVAKVQQAWRDFRAWKTLADADGLDGADTDGDADSPSRG